LSMSFERYMKDMVEPMRTELTRLGIKELRTPDEVAEQLDQTSGTSLIVVNSVCGCAAGQCRPGVAQALQSEVIPDQLFTVFAGQDKEATSKAREYFLPYPPSSPSIAIMKDGKLVYMIERYQIENRSAEEIAKDLEGAFQEYCS
jgi:putative YphP/YqiW family bacilliredoxin